MITMKHTPGPWRVSNDELGYGSYDILADTGGWRNLGIATTIDGRFSDYKLGTVALPSEEVAANAEFIVRACNAHDDLLDALVHAQTLLGLLGVNEGNMKKIRAAIQKAGGE